MEENTTVRISLAGDLGSGKSTVGEMLAKILNVPKYTVGTKQREMAAQYNMDTTQFNEYIMDKPEFDKIFDDWQRSFEDCDHGFIMDSRLGFHFVPSTFAFYLSIDIKESARRIMNANRENEKYSSIEEAIEKIKARREYERERFISFYGVDILNMDNYDCIIDTTSLTPEQVVEKMVEAYKKANK